MNDQDQKKCEIIGDGLAMELTGVFRSSSALIKNRGETKHGVVITADVKEGKVVLGEKIRIKSLDPDSPPVEDTVVRIEINNHPVHFATRDNSVGICLAECRQKDITPFLPTP